MLGLNSKRCASCPKFTPRLKTPEGVEETRRTLPWVALLTLAVLARPGAVDLARQGWPGQCQRHGRPPRDVPDKDILSRPQAAQRRAAPAPASAASGASAAASAPATALEREIQARQSAPPIKSRPPRPRPTKSAMQPSAPKAAAARAAKISALESGQRIARMNDKGEREVLDDAGRADEQRRAREAVAANCK